MGGPAEDVLNRKRARHRRWLRWRRWVGFPRPRDTCFVLSAGRDGSNLLVSYLESIPQLRTLGEVLNPSLAEGLALDEPPDQAFQHIERSLNALGPGIAVVKIHFAQLEDRGIGIDRLAARFPRVKFIVLYRQSLARQYVSIRAAVASGQWLLKNGQARKEPTITLDREGIRGYCAHTRGKLEEVIACPDVMVRAVLISYEQLAEQPQALFDRTVFPFLGLKPRTIQTDLRKQNTRSLREIVENYDEVEDLLTAEEARQDYTAVQSSQI